MTELEKEEISFSFWLCLLWVAFYARSTMAAMTPRILKYPGKIQVKCLENRRRVFGQMAATMEMF